MPRAQKTPRPDIPRAALAKLPEGEPTFFAEDREAWRAWLSENGGKAKAVWLLFLKRSTGKRCISLAEADEEALCFGWIDGKLRSIDGERHLLRFSPRHPGSIWSASNKARAEKLIAEGRMTKAGMKLVEAAKRSGEWDRPIDVRSAEVPEDLAAALAGDAEARRYFEALAISYRKQYVAWLLAAKRPETRQKRVRAVVDRCRRGIKPGIDL